VPPLRERPGDIALLISEFMSRNLGKDATMQKLPGKILAALDQHDWPGNVRELQNVLERYLTFGEMVFSDFGIQTMDTNHDLDAALSAAEASSSLTEAMDIVEHHMMLKALEKNHWRKGITAKELGLNMRTMQRKLKKHGF